MIRFDLIPQSRVRTVRREYSLYPSVDISENKDNYSLKFEIPGMAREDVKIWIEKDMLMVSGEKKQNLDENEIRHLGERRFGKFERSFWIPEDADREKVKAEFVNGLLTITVPKAAESRPREIKIG
ncbi:MAG: Hsp20/alpha crystallin family protein [Candidatus Zixiibacteriota bacterium]|nr:MAG: Hsp20/alpha crystallin family protein [candidate division Zixibacteria bacterium]